MTALATAVHTTCAYCGVGCGIRIDTQAQQLTGDPQHPANHGRLCVKGSSLLETLGEHGRLLAPRIHGRDTDWDEALDLVAARFQDIIATHGPEAVAFYVSGQLLTEDYYVANKLMKGFIGSANIDTNSRLCMSSAVAAHKRAFGADAVPGCYEDLELADLVVLTGSNTAWAHPIVYQRIQASREARAGKRVVVIDPRRTATCDGADLHLAIAPDSDALLFNGLLVYLADQGRLDPAFIANHSNGFDTALATARAEAPDVAAVAAGCGVDEADVRTFFEWFAATPRTVTLFSQGVNQSGRGVDKGNAIINVHLATGRIGKDGACPFSITGQPNAMGGREVGGLANQLAAHMELDNPAHRATVAGFWGSDKLAPTAGLKAVDMFQAVAAGKIKAIWIMATNPAVSLPDADKVKAALAGCDFVVVSDCVADTDTARLAHVLLPAATWGERDGTVTNSERTISRQRPFLPLPGQAQPDWWIVTQVAQRLGFAEAFAYDGPAAIFREHAQLSATDNGGVRDFDLSAWADLSPAEYDALAPTAWPVTAAAPTGTARLFSDGRFYTPDGRARFLAVQGRVEPLPADQLLLNTGRLRDQWHTMTRTGRAERLLAHRAEPFIELHPSDLARYGLADGALVRVHNDHGECRVAAREAEGQRPGTAFMPIHWTEVMTAAARVSALAPAITDPISGQPKFKQLPVRLSPLPVHQHGLVFSLNPVALPEGLDYWCRIPAGPIERLRLAHGEAALSSLAALMALSGLADDPSVDWLDAEDSHQQAYRVAALRAGKLVFWAAVGPERIEADEDWLLGLMRDGLADGARITVLLGAPLGAGADLGPVVCACHRVRENTLKDAIAGGCGTVKALGDCTHAGTNCGSCIPELKRLIACMNVPA